MNDFEPKAAPAHPAPPDGWVPFSGLALTSFILSLVFFVFAMLGLWILELIPLALGIWTIATVKRGAKRGRMLAFLGIVISLSAGSCTYRIHTDGIEVFGGMGRSLLTALSSSAPAEERDAALKSWAWPKALEKDPQRLAQWRARHAQVTKAYGAWSGELDLPSPLLGFVPLFLAPDDVTDVETGEEPRASWTRGGVVWIPALFERGTVYLAIVLLGGDAEAYRDMQEDFQQDEKGQPVPLVGDLRYFRTAEPTPPPPAEKGG